jgi:osmotically-inducible protein OsmY
VVTLTGYIDTYAGKLAAERAVKHVRGVRAVANDLIVRLSVDRTDADIAQDAALALGLRPAIGEHVQAVVHHGHVTLTGQVQWLYQKQQAESAMKHIRGVVGVRNHVTVVATPDARDLSRRIRRALHTTADVDARGITVAVEDDRVTLRGTVASCLQRDAAERAAASAPGIARVDNEIVVIPVESEEIEPIDDIC